MVEEPIEDIMEPTEQLAYNSAQAFALASHFGRVGEFEPGLAYSGIAAMAKHPYAAAEFLPEILSVPDASEYLTDMYNNARVSAVAADAMKHRSAQTHRSRLDKANKLALCLGASRDDIMSMSDPDNEFNTGFIELRSRMYRRNYGV